ncbi:MAG: hypothetical protein ACX93N_10165 [Pseudohaliea sp.]
MTLAVYPALSRDLNAIMAFFFLYPAPGRPRTARLPEQNREGSAL